jgi:hypothetical protein
MGQKLRFMVAHRGLSFPCIGWLHGEDRRLVALGLDNASPGNSGAPRVWRAGDATVQSEPDWRAAREEISMKILALNELLHSGMPWEAMLSCRHSPGAIGSIIEAAEIRRQEMKRVRHEPNPPLSGGPAARAWSRESSK